MFSVSYEADLDKGNIQGGDGSVVVYQDIQFQHGPIQENGVNGVQNEEVLELLAMRLRALNVAFPCRENSIAITKIEEAWLWLRHRTAIRQSQGVEGKHEAHVS